MENTNTPCCHQTRITVSGKNDNNAKLSKYIFKGMCSGALSNILSSIEIIMPTVFNGL